MTTSSSLDDRCAGSLWGLAWGDVLGVPIESWSATDIATAYGSYDDLPSSYPAAGIPAKKKERLRPLGIHSDDTAQALALVVVCLQPGSFSPQAWGRALVDGARKKAWRGTGKRFDEA